MSYSQDTRRKLHVDLVEYTSKMKGAIPVLPLCLAWFCALCNILVPGLGKLAFRAFHFKDSVFFNARSLQVLYYRVSFAYALVYHDFHTMIVPRPVWVH